MQLFLSLFRMCRFMSVGMILNLIYFVDKEARVFAFVSVEQRTRNFSLNLWNDFNVHTYGKRVAEPHNGTRKKERETKITSLQQSEIWIWSEGYPINRCSPSLRNRFYMETKKKKENKKIETMFTC